MTKRLTFVFGGDEFHIEPLNLGQLAEVLPLLDSLRAGAISVAQQFVLALDVIEIALSENYPEVKVRKLHASQPELLEAFNVLMEASGFVTKVGAPGESVAGATPPVKRSTSRKSAAA